MPTPSAWYSHAAILLKESERRPMTSSEAPAKEPRTALAKAFVEAVEGYGIADAEGTDPLFFVDTMLGSLRASGFAIEAAAKPSAADLPDRATLRHRIHYLLSVVAGVQTADNSWDEIDAILEVE